MLRAYSVPDPPDCAFPGLFPPTVLKEDNVELLVVKYTAIPSSPPPPSIVVTVPPFPAIRRRPASRQGLHRHINTPLNLPPAP